MANIFTSSIGKKLIMSISGLFLIVFMCVHAFVNGLSLISNEAFNAGCEFMALPVISVMVPVLAAGFVIHIVYAFVLNYMNYKARGTQRYAVANKAKTDDWASKNMLVLGIIVVLGLGLHLFNFWANMQLPEVLHKLGMHVEPVVMENVANGSGYIARTFTCPVYAALYVVWLAALWFHLTHGFWSAMQTLGINNKVWFCRWKAIGNVVVTLIILGFLAVVVAGFFGLGALGTIECAGACC